MRRSITKILGALLITMLLPVFTACDVHEFPEPGDGAGLILRLEYATDMPQWEYPIEESRTIVPSKSVQNIGEMRYIIHLYPINTKSASDAQVLKEFVFTRDLANGYNAEFLLDVPAGDYTLMVWSDIKEHQSEDFKFYNASDFSRISLQGEHEGNNDYRDAFRGSVDISIKSSIQERDPDEAVVNMVRPLAKYEFVTTDVEEFIDREVRAAISRGEIDPQEYESTFAATKAAALTGIDEATYAPENAPGNAPTKGLSLEDYKIKIFYTGFMPDVYNIFSDKPADSSVGVVYDGKMSALNEKEASLGFDYVFVNGVESAVTVQVAIYNKDDERLSITEPINVPLRRSQHTVLKGKFLMQNASGGVSINPSFNGDHNVVFE